MNRPKVMQPLGPDAAEGASPENQPLEEPVAELPIMEYLPHEGPDKRIGPADRRAPDSPMRGGLTGRRRGRPRLGKAVARDLSRDEEILKIAVEVVWRRGFAGTKLSDIAEAAGIVKGSLYHYFDSKEEIYARLVNNVRSLFDGEADQLATGSAIERLEHFIRTRVAVILQHPLEIALLNRDLVRMKGAIGDWAREGPKKNFAVIRKIILQGQKEGVFRPADPDLVSSMILGVLAHVPNWYHREHPTQPEELMREVLEYALGGVVMSIELIPKRS